MELHLPNRLPALVLPQTVLFPGATIPLYIFEFRYRRMLADALDGDRVIVLATGSASGAPGEQARIRPVATAGILRMSALNADGTSNVALQGIARVRVEPDPDAKLPYPVVAATPLETFDPSTPGERERMREEFQEALDRLAALGGADPDAARAVFRDLGSIGQLADFAAHALCEDPAAKQELLETLDDRARLRLVIRALRRDAARLALRKKLQGELPNDDIGDN